MTTTTAAAAAAAAAALVTFFSHLGRWEPVGKQPTDDGACPRNIRSFWMNAPHLMHPPTRYGYSSL
jgi:hypothetical protein